MSQTSSSAAVSASTTGSVCTTVEGKLITSRPTAPSRMATSSGSSGISIRRPRSAIRASFSRASLRWAK